MHSVTEIGGRTEPRWNGMILSKGWCPVISQLKLWFHSQPVYALYVLSSGMLGLLKLTKAGLVPVFFFFFNYTSWANTNIWTHGRSERCCIFIKVLTLKSLSLVVLAKLCILYYRTATRCDLRMWRLHPECVAEQRVINRSGWARLVLTEVFHKQRRVVVVGGNLSSMVKSQHFSEIDVTLTPFSAMILVTGIYFDAPGRRP